VFHCALLSAGCWTGEGIVATKLKFVWKPRAKADMGDDRDLATTILHEAMEAYMNTHGWHIEHKDVADFCLMVGNFVYDHGFNPRSVIGD
jgi:hypothetical protein